MNIFNLAGHLVSASVYNNANEHVSNDIHFEKKWKKWKYSNNVLKNANEHISTNICNKSFKNENIHLKMLMSLFQIIHLTKTNSVNLLESILLHLQICLMWYIQS